ncbi:MAG: efflux RND transporter permease subunit [bacterium]|nr:efflux RND transporter permease subunit [bacterium]
MSLSQLSIRRPVGTVMLVVCALVLGFFSLTRLPVDLIPRIIYPRIFLSVEFESADPAVVEEQVTKIIEQELATTEGLVRLYTRSQEGRARVWMFFDFKRDIDLALQDAITKFNLARRNLPNEIQQQIQKFQIFKADPAQRPIIEFALSSKSKKGQELQAWANQVLAPQLMVVPGTASVEAFGGQNEEIQILVDFPRLQSLGLNLSSVLARIRSENLDITGGRVVTESREYTSRTLGKVGSAKELSDLIFRTPDGRKVYLRDFAKVVDSGQEQRIFTWFNGAKSVKVVVLKQPNANTLEVIDGIKRRIEFLRLYNILPADVSFTPVADQSFFIRSSIWNVLTSVLIGGTLAILVVFLFLGSLRRTAIIALAIPVASIFTFFFMWAGGLTFNIFSLGGLAIGVGMLVDNAIVMLENISRVQAAEGGDPVAASERAAREVDSAMMASTITNLASVIPFLLISGYMSLLFRELILTISFAFICSLLVALTAVPMLSASLLQLPRRSGVERWLIVRFFADWLDWLRESYRRGLTRALAHRWAVISAVFLVCGVSFFLLEGLGNELIPEVDDGRFTVDLRFSPGTKLEYNKEIVQRVHDTLRRDVEVENVFATAGGRLFTRSFAINPTTGRIEGNLKPGYSIFPYLKKLRARLARLDLPDARFFAYKSRIRGLRTSNTTHNKSFSLSVRGEKPELITRLAVDLVTRLQGIPGLVNLQVDEVERRPELKVHLDRERAAEVGLSVEEVGTTVGTAVDGTVTTYLTRKDRRVPVRVKLADIHVRSAEDLENLPLFPQGREPIRLRHVAQVRRGQTSSVIVRIDQNRMVEITGDITDRSIGEVSRDVRARLANFKIPPGYFVLPGDDEQTLKKSNRELMIVTLLAIFLVYVVMAVQYDSMVKPFVIIFAVPPALAGALMGLYLTGTPFGATALIGVILLVGIVVNNSIVMVEYISQLQARGGGREEAILEGAVVRLRPILMTTCTTVLALIPLALGWGQGSEMLQPLGVVVMSGLTLSALVTLFLTPCLYEVIQGGVAVLRRWVGLEEKGATGAESA